jgi:hypothetical protein
MENPMPEPEIARRLHPDLGALWRHRALVLAALYGFVALVGALYYALLLGQFGLNAFHYWEASDFLLATFREPVTILFGLIAVSFYFSLTDGRGMNDLLFGRVGWIRRLVRYDRWRNARLMRPQLGPVVSVLLALLWFVVVMGSIASLVAVKARRGDGEPVRWATEGTPLRSARLLTTTNRFVFLVEPGATPREARLLAVPVDALTLLEHCGARRGGLRAWVRGPERCEDAAPTVVPAADAATPPVAVPTTATP